MADTMKTLGLFVLLALCTCVLSRDTDRDSDHQREPRRPGEEEFTRNQDNEFDRKVGNDSPRPRRGPTRSQVRDAYREQRPRLLSEASTEERRQIRQDTDSMTFNPYVEYLSSDEWTSVRNNLTCCPPALDYGCESQRVNLPCFFQSYGRRQSQWCCPFYPENQTIKKCKCRRCAILKPKCAKTGRCQRRYKLKSVYAICYHNDAWSKVRYITTYLPTSCYCLSSE